MCSQYKTEVLLSNQNELSNYDKRTSLNELWNEDVIKGYISKFKQAYLIILEIDPAPMLLESIINVQDSANQIINETITGQYKGEARFWGLSMNQFIFISPKVNGDELIRSLLLKARNHFQKVIGLPLTEQLIQIKAGYTQYDSGKSLSQNIGEAFLALRSCQEQGASCALSYKNALITLANNRTRLTEARKLYQALLHEKLSFIFQPMVKANSREIEFHECLLRIADDQDELKSAGPLIPAAEKTGLITDIDQFVLHRVIDNLKEHNNLKLSLNISGISLIQPQTIKNITNLLTNNKVADRLIFEITETALAKDFCKVAEFVKCVKNLGGRVAIDDFGSGYTSFAQLQELEIDLIKIDGSLISKISSCNSSKNFIKTIIEFAKFLKLKTVAEFVETKETAEILESLNIDYMQGKYFNLECPETLNRLAKV